MKKFIVVIVGIGMIIIGHMFLGIIGALIGAGICSWILKRYGVVGKDSVWTRNLFGSKKKEGE